MFLVTHQGRGTFKHIAVSVQRVDIHGLALPGALVQEGEWAKGVVQFKVTSTDREPEAVPSRQIDAGRPDPVRKSPRG